MSDAWVGPKDSDTWARSWASIPSSCTVRRILGATRSHRCLWYRVLVSPGTVLSDESPCTKSTIGPQFISPISDVESLGLGMAPDIRLQARS